MQNVYQLIDHAILNHQVIRIYYLDAWRTVEPHMLADDKRHHLALSAWFVSGYSASGEGPGWRIYHLDRIHEVQVTEFTFDFTRPGYQPDGGKVFTNIRSAC
jgi:hypothetical protein